jgi:hypothetical protein
MPAKKHDIDCGNGMYCDVIKNGPRAGDWGCCGTRMCKPFPASIPASKICDAVKKAKM